ncbi:MAG: restriction endonuclease subunit S [Albidovulum sp.]|nr:restriction endonuclease subunit S [Albidovulum sp.]
MPVSWLSDIADIIMGQSPPGDTCNNSGSGMPLLNGPTEFGPHYPSPVQFTIDPRKRALQGDLLFCVRGSVGRMNWADQDYAIGRGVAAIRHRENLNLQPLVRGLIEEQLPTLLQSATGSTFPNVSAKQLGILQVPKLSNDQLFKVASLLGALDDKIELNRRMNETLEAMARAIFRDWFVDFGPTRAKAEGREPYLAPELWDLFPDALDGEGKPDSWEARRLENFLEFNYGKSLPARKRTPGKFAVYGSGGLVGTHDTALIEGPAVIVGRKGTVGSLYWEDGPAFPIDTVFYVVPRIGSLLFSYQLLASLPLCDMNTDAAVPGLNRGNAYRLEFPLPTSELISAFEEIVGALWKRRTINLEETLTLAQTRDLLLPKLMSGEIRLGEAEKELEAVA